MVELQTNDCLVLMKARRNSIQLLSSYNQSTKINIISSSTNCLTRLNSQPVRYNYCLYHDRRNTYPTHPSLDPSPLQSPPWRSSLQSTQEHCDDGQEPTGESRRWSTSPRAHPELAFPKEDHAAPRESLPLGPW